MQSVEVIEMTPDDRLIYLVFTAQQKLRTYLTKMMVKENVKVTTAQAGILFLLKQKDGRTMSELSQILSIDNSTITGLVDRLEKSGLVRRNASIHDRRASHVFIRPQGIEEVDKAKRVIRMVNQEIKNGFSEEDLDSFNRILRSFFHKFDSGPS